MYMYSDEYNNEEMNQNNIDTSNVSNKGSSNKKMLLIVILAIVLIAIVIVYLLFGKNNSNNQDDIIPQITISTQKETIAKNNSLELKAIVTNIENALIIWTSSDEAVATVNSMGLVTGVNYGIVTITATYIHTNNKPYSISCEVTVSKTDPNIVINSVKFPEGELLISEGSEYQLQLVIEPSEASVTDVLYEPTDETIVKVDENGKVTALKEGVTSIRLNVNDGEFTDQINVNVTKETVNTQIFIPVSSINFKDQLLTLKVGGSSQKLLYDILPQEALSSNLKWESSDPTVASVNDGIVTPLKVGTAEITVRSINGKMAIMSLEVVAEDIKVTGIEILNESKIFNLKVGETSQILTNVLPANATNKGLSYKSDKDSVATVTSSGFIIANGSGTATITITSLEDSKVTAKVTVNVTSSSSQNGGNNGSSSNIKLSDITMNKNSTYTVTASEIGLKGDVKIGGCIVGSTNYASITDSEEKCIINSKGITGETYFTIRTSDGVSKTVKLTITDGEVGTISGINSEYNVEVGSYISVNPTVSGSLRVTGCSISDPNVATANTTTGSNGIPYCSVKGVKEGSTTLTITASSSGQTVTKTTEITVTDQTTSDNNVAVTGITVTPTLLNLKVGDKSTITATISPSNATNQTINWSSSNTSVATVDNGEVKARGVGNATITVTTDDGKKTATVNVEIIDYKCSDMYVNSCQANGKFGDDEFIECRYMTLYNASYRYICALEAPANFNTASVNNITSFYFENEDDAINKCEELKNSIKDNKCVLDYKFYTTDCEAYQKSGDWYKKTTCTKQ